MSALTAPKILADRWAAYQQEHPKSRIRDAANALGTSEGVLLVADQVFLFSLEEMFLLHDLLTSAALLLEVDGILERAVG